MKHFTHFYKLYLALIGIVSAVIMLVFCYRKKERKNDRSLPNADTLNAADALFDDDDEYETREKPISMFGLLVVLMISYLSVFIPQSVIEFFDRSELYGRNLVNNHC